MSTPLEVFCCYAREDQEMLVQLKKHLMPLQRQGQITIWSDTNLDAGVEWEKELHQHLESANIILLLISPDFMASDYCYSTEMRRAIERHDQGSAHVISILLRPTFWQNAPFAKLQVIPMNAEPVTSWSDRDKAFYDIVIQINQIITRHQTVGHQSIAPDHPTTPAHNPKRDALSHVNEDSNPLSQISSQVSALHLIREPAEYIGLSAFQITLDGKKVGTIREKGGFTIEVEPGHHTIFLRAVLYLSPHLTFDIAPGEQVTFHCRAIFTGIRLWK
jgi:TIR domain